MTSLPADITQQLCMPDYAGLKDDAAAISALNKVSKTFLTHCTVKDRSMVNLLPLFLRLEGKPYTLKNHFPMEPLFSTQIPARSLWKCGRQVSKSTSLTSQSLISTSVVPFLTTLFVLPLYEMARRLSQNVMKPMIEDSPLRDFLVDRKCEQNVLQRGYKNRSKMIFSYAFKDTTRVRGIKADRLIIDEVQDIDWDHLPVIRATLDAANPRFGVEQYSGTALTLDNTIEILWQKTSQAEWVMTCEHCKHHNVPSIEYDAMDMIGPVVNIVRYKTGLVCARCKQPMVATSGRWIHHYPDRFASFSGYHVPQIILPMHYTVVSKWRKIHDTMNTRPDAFANETMGESYDSNVKMVTLNEIKAASFLDIPAEYDRAVQWSYDSGSQYVMKILGVDWGGGGEDETSFTKLAVLGMLPDGRVDNLYGESLSPLLGEVEQAKRILKVAYDFRVDRLAHDYAGAGQVHEEFLLQFGYPAEKLIPFSYMRLTSKPMISFVTNPHGGRFFYSLDKTRSLLITCARIRHAHIRFPQYERVKELVDDFMHISKEIHENQFSGSLMVVVRQPGLSDDYVHAINYAACGLIHTTGVFPNISEIIRFKGPTLTPVKERILDAAWDVTTLDAPQR